MLEKTESMKLENTPAGWEYILWFDGVIGNRTVTERDYDLSITSPFGRNGIDYREGGVVVKIPLFHRQDSDQV